MPPNASKAPVPPAAPETAPPEPTGLDVLALALFREPRESLVFGASRIPEEHLRVKRTLDPILKDTGHPRHQAAVALWEEVRKGAEAHIREALAEQFAPCEGEVPPVDALLGVATLRRWPEVVTAVLLRDYEAGDPWTVLRAGNIDQNTDFLALHLRSLLAQPDLRETTLEFMLLLAIQASGADHDRLCDSPTQRHLAAALGTGQVGEDELTEALARMESEGKVRHEVAVRAPERLRHAAQRYADLLRGVEDEGFWHAWVRKRDAGGKEFDAFFRSDDREFVRSQAWDWFRDPEELSAACHRLARIAYLDPDRTLDERHRAEERLLMLGTVSAERLMSDPERTLADWLSPAHLFGAERDMILTLVAMEDLRSGGAAARILRGALQNPLFRDDALGLMVEVAFRNPPGAMLDALMAAIQNEELDADARETALAEVRHAAEDALGPTMAGWFMTFLAERLKTYTPESGILPFVPSEEAEKWMLPFLHSTEENRLQRSLAFLRFLGGSAPLGVREAALHAFKHEEMEDILPRYRGLLDPQPLLEILKQGQPDEQEVIRQIASDLVVLNEAVQRMGRAERERCREQMPVLLQLRVITYRPELEGVIRSGTRVPEREFTERVLGAMRQSLEVLRRDGYHSGEMFFRPRLTTWTNVLLKDALVTSDEPPILRLLGYLREPIRAAAAALVRTHPPYLPTLLRMLANGSREYRLGALLALEGHPDPGVQREIAALLGDERELALAALKALHGTDDPEVRWEIARALENGGDVEFMASLALGGLESTLLNDPDERIVTAAGQRLFLKRDPATLDTSRLLMGFYSLSGNTLKDDRVGRHRYRWVAVALSRGPDQEAMRAALHALSSHVPFDAKTRDTILKNLSLRVIYELFRSVGAEATVSLIVLAKEVRILEVMRVADEFLEHVKEFSKIYHFNEKNISRVAQSHIVKYEGDLETLHAASMIPGRPESEEKHVRELIRSIYLDTPETGLGNWERTILAAMAYHAKQPIEGVLKIRETLPWTFGDELNRTVVTALYLPLIAEPDGREAFIRDYLDRVAGAG